MRLVKAVRKNVVVRSVLLKIGLGVVLGGLVGVSV